MLVKGMNMFLYADLAFSFEIQREQLVPDVSLEVRLEKDPVFRTYESGRFTINGHTFRDHFI